MVQPSDRTRAIVNVPSVLPQEAPQGNWGGSSADDCQSRGYTTAGRGLDCVPGGQLQHMTLSVFSKGSRALVQDIPLVEGQYCGQTKEVDPDPALVKYSLEMRLKNAIESEQWRNSMIRVSLLRNASSESSGFTKIAQWVADTWSVSGCDLKQDFSADLKQGTTVDKIRLELWKNGNWTLLEEKSVFNGSTPTRNFAVTYNAVPQCPAGGPGGSGNPGGGGGNPGGGSNPAGSGSFE
ncbi:MAG: hypothetical protein HC848_07760 [Limnobacter sp.]|nr:hypothetical protein [Limnobacter sp.]